MKEHWEIWAVVAAFAIPIYILGFIVTTAVCYRICDHSMHPYRCEHPSAESYWWPVIAALALVFGPPIALVWGIGQGAMKLNAKYNLRRMTPAGIGRALGQRVDKSRGSVTNADLEAYDQKMREHYEYF